jgi:hypothetical protein
METTGTFCNKYDSQIFMSFDRIEHPFLSGFASTGSGGRSTVVLYIDL